MRVEVQFCLSLTLLKTYFFCMNLVLNFVCYFFCMNVVLNFQCYVHFCPSIQSTLSHYTKTFVSFLFYSSLIPSLELGTSLHAVQKIKLLLSEFCSNLVSLESNFNTIQKSRN